MLVFSENVSEKTFSVPLPNNTLTKKYCNIIVI